jgi:hypothetical protein
MVYNPIDPYGHTVQIITVYIGIYWNPKLYKYSIILSKICS